METELFKKVKEIGISDIGYFTEGVCRYMTKWRKIVDIHGIKMSLNYYEKEGPSIAKETLCLYNRNNELFIYQIDSHNNYYFKIRIL